MWKRSIKIETWTKRDLITSFFPRLASDANLYFEIIFFYFLTLNNRFILYRKLSLVHKNRL